MTFTDQVWSRSLPVPYVGMGLRAGSLTTTQEALSHRLLGHRCAGASVRTLPALRALPLPCIPLQMGTVSLFHPLKATLEQTQPAVLRGARVFLQQKSSTSLSNGGAV